MGTEFNREQFDAIYPEGIEQHYWTFARNKILKHTLSKQNSGSNILEIGCGKGVVVQYLREKGFNVKGVELAEVPVRPELSPYVKAGTDVFTMGAEECRNIDTVMLLDVIEHIEFPKEFLKSVREKFPALRTFIVTVPACQELFSNYDEFNGHFRRYAPDSLLAEFENMTTKKKELSYFFHSLYIPAKILLNTAGKRPEKIIAPKGPLKKMFHALMAGFFYSEFVILPSTLKGTSLILKIDLN
jgi:hypothetical protein